MQKYMSLENEPASEPKGGSDKVLGGGSTEAAVGERTGYDPYITIIYRFIGLIYTLI